MLFVIKSHPEIAEALATDLAEVETRFGAELLSDLACVNDLVRYVERYRGKMLRPTLLLLSAMAARPDRPIRDEHRTLATVVEMVHMATLVHDDILDEAEIRRKGQTVNTLAGNEAAVMLGDYLISHAYHLCSSLNHQGAARLIAQTTNTVCEGELLQLANRNNWSLDEQTYYQIIGRKTAALVDVSCRLGPMMHELDKAACQAMGSFGYKIGTAFQIIDDVLDLTGDEQVVGKSLGKDLEKGKLTLPLIHRLETAPPAERHRILDLLRTDDTQRTEHVGWLITDTESIDYARRRAEKLVAEAHEHLAVLPESPARQTLHGVADAVISRKR